MPKKPLKTKSSDMIIPVLAILALPRYNFMGTDEMLPTLKTIMKQHSADLEEFRGTQTKFDKAFYNLIQAREQKFSHNGEPLVNFTRATNRTYIMSITPAGRKYLKNNL